MAALARARLEEKKGKISIHRLIHSDWSVNPRKRWLASAHKRGDGWHVEEVRPVGPTIDFVENLFADGLPTLAGFDFPIGLPEAYGTQTGLASFRDALDAFGHGRWSKVFDVTDVESEVAIERPFYPRRSLAGVTRSSLVRRLGVATFDDLLRRCERRAEGRNAACSVFWTLGGNQVGKGATTGWREVIRPALDRGAALWPFDGALAHLAGSSSVVLAETYPAAAYECFGVRFGPGESKRRQTDREGKASAIFRHAAANRVAIGRNPQAMIEDGFGDSGWGEDMFDAIAGLLMMIEVVEGRRSEAPSRKVGDDGHWEGWMLGA